MLSFAVAWPESQFRRGLEGNLSKMDADTHTTQQHNGQERIACKLLYMRCHEATNHHDSIGKLRLLQRFAHLVDFLKVIDEVNLVRRLVEICWESRNFQVEHGRHLFVELFQEGGRFQQRLLHKCLVLRGHRLLDKTVEKRSDHRFRGRLPIIRQDIFQSAAILRNPKDPLLTSDVVSL